MFRKVIFPVCLFAAFQAHAQTSDTTIVRKDGNKEVKIIVRTDAQGKQENKEIVVYKKYEIKDGENEEQVIEEIQRQEDGEKSPANARRKEVIIIDGKEGGKVVHRIDVNMPNIDSLEKVVEIEMEKAGVQIEKGIEGAEKQVERRKIEISENVDVKTEGDTTEIVLGNRKIMIVKDGEDTHVTVKKRKGNKWVDDDGNEENVDDENDGQGYRYEYNTEEKVVVNEDDEDEPEEDEPYRPKFADVDLFGLDLGLNNYFTNGEILQAPTSHESLGLDTWRSINVATHFLPTTLHLFGNGAVNLKTAITLDFNNLRFKNNDFMIRPNADVLTLDSAATLKKHKLVATYLQVPLMLHFKTRPNNSDKSINFSVGGFVGMLLDGKTKRVEENDDVKKQHDDFNLNPLRYGVTARVDFRWIDFYVNYNLSNMFADAQGPNTQLVSAGVNLIDF